MNAILLHNTSNKTKCWLVKLYIYIYQNMVLPFHLLHNEVLLKEQVDDLLFLNNVWIGVLGGVLLMCFEGCFLFFL